MVRLVGRRGGAAILAVLIAILAPGAEAQSGRTALFDRLAGSWTGAGTAAVEGNRPERIRCRADYVPAGPASLRLALRCATDSFNLQIESGIDRDGDRISGSWSEATSGVTGSVSGMVGPDRLRATVNGLGVSAELSLTLRGNSQIVTIGSRGAFTATASMALRRS